MTASEPAEIPSVSNSDTTPSNTQYNPVSDGTNGQSSSSNPRRPGAGALRIQTDFGNSYKDTETDDGGFSDEDDDHHTGYESGPESRRRKFPRASSLLEYTVAEEGEVVRKFDHKLVPFLALLYLLSFLDRSSRSHCLCWKWTKLSGFCRHWECKNCRDDRGLGPLAWQIRMASDRVLYHICSFRMDGFDVPSCSSAYLRFALCMWMGSCGIVPVSHDFIRRYARAEVIAGDY